MNTPSFVICIENSEYTASLEIRKIYQVLPYVDPAKSGHLRLIDESDEDYLYPKTCFLDACLTKSVE